MSLILTLRKQRQEEEFCELEVDKGGPLSEVLASLLYIVISGRQSYTVRSVSKYFSSAAISVMRTEHFL